MLRLVVFLLFSFASIPANQNSKSFPVAEYEEPPRIRRNAYLYTANAKVHPGNILKFKGRPLESSKSFSVNFKEKNEPNSVIVFHMAVRYDLGYIIFNFLEPEKGWQRDQEENLPLGDPNLEYETEFEFQIKIFTRYFEITLDKRFIAVYKLRLSIDMINVITIVGDITLGYEPILMRIPFTPNQFYPKRQGHHLNMGGTLRISGCPTGDRFSFKIASFNKTVFLEFEVRINRNEVVITRPLEYFYTQMKTKYFAYSGERSIPFKRNENFDLDFVNTPHRIMIYYNGRTFLKFPQLKSYKRIPDPATEYMLAKFNGDVSVSYIHFNFIYSMNLGTEYHWYQ